VSTQETRPRHLIPEKTYDYDHPEVIFWTNNFSDRARKRDVMANIEATIKNRRSHAAAVTMARTWLEFSRHVPKFLTLAVARTDDPERQHHLIQIAYDELGGRNKKLIHSRLFVEALGAIGIQLQPRTQASAIKKVLDMLDETLASAASEEAIIGLLLSFEIIAQENIEMLFGCLGFDDSARETLSTTPFFKIHRQDETEHIRHSVANFLRFCTTEAHKEDFMRSFDEGLSFWERFWDQTSRMINVATSACADAA
jgi:hypothetical protein